MMSNSRRPSGALALWIVGSALYSTAAAHGNHGGEAIEEGQTVSSDPIVCAQEIP